MRAISVVIIAQNEAERIATAIRSAQRFADEILVVDGGSTDATGDRAQELGCVVLQNPWPGYAKQRNLGAARAAHPWIFMLDADEEVGDDLAASLNRWKAASSMDADAFAVRRVGDFLGRWLTGAAEHLVRLYHRDRFRIRDVPVHERPDTGDAPVHRLEGTLWHHGFRSIGDHIRRFEAYADLEARSAFERGQRFRLRRLVLRSPARFVQWYCWRGAARRGIPGLFVALLWIYYELAIHMKLYELGWRLANSGQDAAGSLAASAKHE
jgi:glycosyltransferase involved in cell wall biosynthesis